MAAGFSIGAGSAGADASFACSVAASSADVFVGSVVAAGTGWEGEVIVDVRRFSSLVVTEEFDRSSWDDVVLGSFDLLRKIDLNRFLVCPRTSGAKHFQVNRCEWRDGRLMMH